MSEMFDVEIVDTKDEMINYAYDFLTNENKTLFITEYETSLILADKLEDLDDCEIIDRTDYDMDSDSIVYIKKLDDDVYVINEVFTEDGNIRIIENDYVLIQDKLILDDIIDAFIYAEEELEIIGYDEDDSEEDIEPCICCECCHCCDEELTAFDSLDEAQKEFIENMAEISNYDKYFLSEIFVKGFGDGADYSLLSLSKGLKELVEDK